MRLTSLTTRALFYKDRFSLRHKVLALEEGVGAEPAAYAIRNLISAGTLAIETAVRDTETGKLTTMENRVEGPTAVFLTTTDPDIDPETRSRFFILSVEESREQTRAILALQRRRHTLAGLAGSADRDAVLRRHRNFQRLLEPLEVVNPFAERLEYGDDRLQGRRDQPKYLNLIRAIAFVRQLQKEVKRCPVPDGGERRYIEVEADDLRAANELAAEALGRTLDELSRPARDLLMAIERMAEARAAAIGTAAGGPMCTTDVCFTRREVREFAGWSNSRVQRHLAELLELEYVVRQSGRNGLLCRYRLVYEGQGKDGTRFVLGLRPLDGSAGDGGAR